MLSGVTRVLKYLPVAGRECTEKGEPQRGPKAGKLNRVVMMIR